MATILIVDDEEPVRGFLAHVLTGDGYDVRQAIHGRQALELVEKERPDLVLSDARPKRRRALPAAQGSS